MLIRQFGGFATSRSAFNESFFDKVRFIDILYRTGIFAHGGSDSVQTHRSAAELINNSGQQLVVDLVQTEGVYIERLEGILSNLSRRTAIRKPTV